MGQTPFDDMKDLNIACLQTDIVWQDRDANIRHYDDLIGGITADVDLILLPETFNTAFPVDAYGFAEKRNGVTMQWMQMVARKKGSVIASVTLLFWVARVVPLGVATVGLWWSLKVGG